MILLVVDVQKGITNEKLYAFDEFKKNMVRLIDEARETGIEVVYVRHDDGEGSGFSNGDEAFEIYDRIKPLDGEKIFDKKVNSSLNRKVGLIEYLENKHIHSLIVTGLQTDYCVDATVKSAFENGFEVIVPAGCNSTRDNAYMDAETTYKFYNENMWPERYAKCISMDATIQRMKEYTPNLPTNTVVSCGTGRIETERLILREFRYDDAESMMRNWVSDDEVQWMYGEPSYKTKEEVISLLDEYVGRNQSGYYYRWAVIEKESEECIGQVAYFFVDSGNRFAEIEYCIGTAFQGKGYATEATKAVINYGFDNIGLNKVQICVRPSNLPSAKVIEKCGFHKDGVLRQYFFRNGAYEDRMYFSILRDER